MNSLILEGRRFGRIVKRREEEGVRLEREGRGKSLPFLERERKIENEIFLG
jgi:hypothetical protein